ncbi:MAG: primosomal protein N' [Oscillospiraceae bacterium]
MIAKVILTNSKHILDQEFDYKIPPGLEPSVSVGMRVIVPFGIYNNSVEALVVAIAHTSDFARLKPLKCVIGTTPVCSGELLNLCFWMQKQYLCSFYQAYKLMTPPKMALTVQEWLVLSSNEITEVTNKLTPIQLEIVNFLKGHDNVAEYGEVHEGLNRPNLKKSIYALEKKGIIEIHEKIDEGMKSLKVRKVNLAIPLDDAYLEVESLFNKKAHVQANMILVLCENPNITTADLVMLSLGNYSALTALEKKGIIEITHSEVSRDAFDKDDYDMTNAYTPTNEQAPIIDYLNNLIDNEKHEKILLHGVTGSGKTEVFLQAIDNCINHNKRAIMLVPEISLTPQMVDRFVGRFGEKVAVIHSGLSVGERFDQWNKINNGEVYVVVGARSAIFAPFDNIGIIILDEEHENSYKSEISPRYHAKDIAIKRAEWNKAPLLLASATPSVSSYYNAKIGKYKLFEMRQRYNQNSMPKSIIVDMRSELFDLKNPSVISLKLQHEILKNLERGEKTILFLNRRGFNTFVSCRECGHVIECTQCSIPMTYHMKENCLTCHYCGYTQPNVTICPECGSKHIKFFGTGTQKIESELYTLFPNIKILRMDFDTTSRKGGHELILNRFKNGEADILLGTQMVTKGLDFHDVTLVGVLAADTALGIDDFRANERSFSLITQVCGRAGRGDIEGRAIIQTYQPQNPTIAFAKVHDYKGFYENEIRYRKRLCYPPFSDIISIMVSGEDENTVSTETNDIGTFFKELEKTDTNIIKILGPGPAPILKIKNKFRYRILIKVSDAELLLESLHLIYDKHNKPNAKTNLAIDVNPINMS